MSSRMILRRIAGPVLVGAAALALQVPGAGAATIDPELLQAFGAARGDQRLDVMVVLDEGLDLEPIVRDLEGAPWRLRRQIVVDALKAHAERTQRELLATLDEADASGDVVAVRPLWLSNVITFRGNRASVERLAATATPAYVTEAKYFATTDVQREPATPVAESMAGASDAGTGAPRGTVTAWNLEWSNIPVLWKEGYRGDGVVVAHFDTGVWLNHPDLVNQLWTNPAEIPANGIDDDGNGYVDDVHGWDFANRDSDPTDDVPESEPAFNHGTHTAGTVCGDGTRGIRTGAAPNASLMVCKVALSEDGAGPLTAVWEGHQYAIEMGARILTMSMGAPGFLDDRLMQLERRNADAIRAAGAAFFVSAGNAHAWFYPPHELGSSARVPSPWNRDRNVPWSSRGGVISVGATAYESNDIWPHSSQGPADWSTVDPWHDWSLSEDNGLTKPDVSAPGEGIQSTLRAGGWYTDESWSGTSMATPLVAGIAALMLQKNPELTPQQIDQILQQTAVDLGATGKDNVFGAGGVDAAAAMAAVPEVAIPYIVIESSRFVDASGDGLIDPGEEFTLDLTLANNSNGTAAESVVVDISVLGESFGVIVDGHAEFGSIPSGSNSDHGNDELRLRANDDIAHGSLLRVLVSIQAAGGYRQEVDLRVELGLPEMRDHDVGAVTLTVTDRATLGYWDLSFELGSGFGPTGSSSGLGIGGFWGGNDGWYVCNRDFIPTDAEEWDVATDPTGRVDQPEEMNSDQDFTAAFDDRLHPEPRGIRVKQHSMAWSEPGIDEFVLLEYTIENTSDVAVDNYYAGLFCDFDIGNPLENLGGVDTARNLAYVSDPATREHYGIFVREPATPANVTLVHNPTWVWPRLQIVDTNKWILLQGNHTLTDGNTPSDYSALVSAGPYDLAPGETATVVFGIAYGQHRGALSENVDRALALELSPSVPITDGGSANDAAPPTYQSALYQNVPNPFNPTTTIRFELESSEDVTVSVYDVHGRRIRELTSGRYDAGAYTVRWDGTDQTGVRVASGVYLYRLETSSRVLTRKMMLVK